jgi:predicted HD phosphohydrolase
MKRRHRREMMGAVPENTPVKSSESSLDDVIELLRASTAFDLTPGPGPGHHLLDHSLQTAAVLRTSYPDDPELQLAGLVHDLGHMLPPYKDEAHAQVAATFLRPVLGDRIAELVRLHVPAKRYLVTTDPRYGEALGEDSVISMERQGGLMSADELRDFESEPLSADALVLRRADEAGKVPGLAVPDLDTWIAPLRAHSAR